MDHELKYVTANGIRFAYFEVGDGPLVLCLHGFPDTAHSFDLLLPKLAAGGYRAVAPFMRGYSPSGLAPDGDYSPLALGRDVAALIEALGAENADVVGHDWGAYAAYCSANMTPARIRRLVMMSIPHIGGAANSFRQFLCSWYVMFFQLPGIPERRVRRDDFAFIDRLYRRWSPNWSPAAYDLRPVKAALAAPGGLQAALGYYRAMFRNSTRQAWQVLSTKTQAPTLLITGETDGCVGPEVFARIHDAFTGPFEFRLLPSLGHFPHREAADDVGETIVGFLRGGHEK